MAEKLRRSRAQILTAILLIVLGIFLIRLFYIQIIQHKNYLAKADAMQIQQQTIPAERGQIYTADGDGGYAPLVLNEPVYTVFADPYEVKDAAAVKNEIESVAGGEAISDAFGKLGDKTLRYVVLAKQITRTQAEKIKAANLEGVGLTAGTKRVYPEGQLASQLLGFVNADGQGQYGIEQYLNKELSGTPGELKTVTDVRHIPLTIGSGDVSVPAKNGENVVLTIDRNIQAEAEKDLAAGLKNVGATSGSVLVMNPQNGAVLAMANWPT
ncbi:MAG: hypothetical protein LBM73_00095, partial [Candidatus Nomurabacteria bacterium]|nr:hypothetical protein [Candidatus Nomurabacteria bacterium]